MVLNIVSRLKTKISKHIPIDISNVELYMEKQCFVSDQKKIYGETM